MKDKEILVFGASGQIGRHLIRKLTKNNHKVKAVTRNYHQKAYILKTQANFGYLEIIESNIFDYEKIDKLIQTTDVCINLIGILTENKKNTFHKIHAQFPDMISQLCSKHKIDQLIHVSALGVNDAVDSLLKSCIEAHQSENREK